MKTGMKDMTIDMAAFLTAILWIGLFLNIFSYTDAWGQEATMQLMDTEALAAKYVAYLKSHSSWKPDEMEIQNVRINPRTIWLPKGKVSYSIQESAGGALLGRVSSLVTIMVDGKPVRRARACATIEVYKSVLCAAQGLRRGQIISERDLTRATMPLSKLKTGFYQRPGDVIGMAARRSLRPGQAITADSLMRPAVVKRGSRVMIVAQSPAIIVKVPGQVQEKGAVGDFVRVMNLGSHRVVIARVEDRNTVRVNF